MQLLNQPNGPIKALMLQSPKTEDQQAVVASSSGFQARQIGPAQLVRNQSRIPGQPAECA